MFKKSGNILQILFIIASFTLAAFIFGCSRDKGTKIVVKGSTTVLPITQRTAEEYRKENKREEYVSILGELVSLSPEDKELENQYKKIKEGAEIPEAAKKIERAEEERLKAEEDVQKAEEEKKRAEEEAKRAESEQMKAEEERKKAEDNYLKYVKGHPNEEDFENAKKFTQSVIEKL